VHSNIRPEGVSAFRLQACLAAALPVLSLGRYQLRLCTPGKPATLSDRIMGDAFGFWGNNNMGEKSWMILVCDNCGNVQMFRPDLAGRDKWKHPK
jgi:hypothetical protein